MSQIIAAIDIGTTKIVAIVGEKTKDGKLKILGMGRTPSKGVKRGVVLNIEETADAISTAVESAEKISGYEFDNVFVGIAGQHIKSIKSRGYKFIENKVIKQEDIDYLHDEMNKISIDPGEEIIHIIPQNYIVDNETGVKQPIGIAGNRLEGNYHIVIGQISSAKNISQCINNAGLLVESLVLEPLASSAAVLTKDEKEAGVALIDIGGGTTDIAVYYDDIIRHTAVIPYGGNVVTTDIKNGCSILKRQAELLKIQYGSALGEMAVEDRVVTIPGISGREPKEISFKNLAYIIQARMEEIIDAVSFEIENSGYFEKLSAGIVITGGGALLKHLSQLIKFKTGMDIRIGLPGEHLAPGVNNDVNQAIYSTSIGLILKGYEYINELESGGGKRVKKGDKSAIFTTFFSNLVKMFDEKDDVMN